MSSISSARKGRKQHDRDDDFIRVTADFRQTIDLWQQTERVNDGADDFRLEIGSLSGGHDWEVIELSSSLCLPATLIRRGPIPVYKVALTCPERNNESVYYSVITIPDGADEPIDILACQQATQEQIREALEWTPAPEPEPPAPELPTYRTLERQPGDSFLDFECGARTDKPIVVSPRWTVFAFHNQASRVVGRIRVSLDLSRFAGRSLELKIFDAFGACLLETNMHNNSVQLDQVRIPSGDTVIAFRAPNGATGEGDSRVPHAKLLAGELPARPTLDSLILEPQSDMPSGEIAVPRFIFSAQ